MRLVVPAREHLPGYIAALEKKWSPDNMRPEAAREELAKIERDADSFLALQDDRDAKGGRCYSPQQRSPSRTSEAPFRSASPR